MHCNVGNFAHFDLKLFHPPCHPTIWIHSSSASSCAYTCGKTRATMSHYSYAEIGNATQQMGQRDASSGLSLSTQSYARTILNAPNSLTIRTTKSHSILLVPSSRQYYMCRPNISTAPTSELSPSPFSLLPCQAVVGPRRAPPMQRLGRAHSCEPSWLPGPAPWGPCRPH